MHFVRQMRSYTMLELISQFAAYIQASVVSPSSLSCLPVL